MSHISEKNKKISPIYHAVIAVLLACVAFVFPVAWLEARTSYAFAGGLVRLVFSVVAMIYLIFLKQSSGDFLVTKKWLQHVDLLLFALIICIANFPLFSLSEGHATLSRNPSDWVQLIFLMVSISLFEELFFRAILYTALYRYFILKKYSRTKSVVLAIVLSSVIFALAHLFNLLNTPAFFVMLQVGYTFLLALLFSALYYFTKSILPAIIIHALFNIAGLAVGFLGTGIIWTTNDRIFGTILFVVAGAAFAIISIQNLRREHKQTFKPISRA